MDLVNASPNQIGAANSAPRLRFQGVRFFIHPGVEFTLRHKFFWSGEDVGAEFTFRGHAFVIETNQWDGALEFMRSRVSQVLEADDHALTRHFLVRRDGCWNCYEGYVG